MFPHVTDVTYLKACELKLIFDHGIISRRFSIRCCACESETNLNLSKPTRRRFQ